MPSLEQFFDSAKDLILPHVSDDRSRQTILNDAFFFNYRPLLDVIDRSGAPNDFATHLLMTLIQREEKGALMRLLDVMRGYYGAGKDSEIEALIQAVPDLFIASAPEAAPVVARTTDKRATDAQLRQVMERRLSMGELRTAAFDLGLEWDNLEGGTKSEKIISLINTCHRQEMIAALISEIKMLNPRAFG